MLSCRADGLVYFGEAFGLEAQLLRGVERMQRRYHFLLWYLCIYTGVVIDLFPNLTILKGSIGSIASWQTSDMSCAVS